MTSVPIQRVLPLVEFLFTEIGTNVGVAARLGVSETAVRKWRRGRPQVVDRRCALAIVREIKAVETGLRAEARRERARLYQAEYRAGRSKVASDGN